MWKNHQEKNLQNLFFVQRFETCVIGRGGSFEERSGIDYKQRTLAPWDKENTLCCLQLKALVPMTGSRTLPIYCNIEIVNISIMLECLSMCFFSSIFFPNLIRFTNKITMLGVHYCGGGLWINIFIFRKGTLANQLNIDDGSKYKSYGIPREDRRRSTFQPIPSVGDFLWCIVIIEGSGPGRGQGDLNPVRRWRAENWGSNCEQQEEVRIS